MEANLVIKANDLTKDFMDGIIKVFSKDATLNITVNYDLPGASAPAKRGPKPKGTSTYTGKKRGPKPKTPGVVPTDSAPKKRGRKPKVAVE